MGETATKTRTSEAEVQWRYLSRSERAKALTALRDAAKAHRDAAHGYEGEMDDPDAAVGASASDLRQVEESAAVACDIALSVLREMGDQR